MATNTKNYNLVKPAGNELADISVINKNMDTIDEQLMPVNSLASEDPKKALAAAQGKVLKEKMGDLSALNTQNKENLVQAINEAAEGSGITVVTQSEYEAMQEAGTVEPDKLYGIVDTYDFSAGNVEISDALAGKLGLASGKNVDKALEVIDEKVEENSSSMLKKDGTVQMTGVLKTVGIGGTQLECGNNRIYSDDNYFIPCLNCYFDGTNWRYSSDGTASYLEINKTSGVQRTISYQSGVKDAICVIDNAKSGYILTDKTGLPLTGGTLSGNLVVDNSSNTPTVRLDSSSRLGYITINGAQAESRYRALQLRNKSASTSESTLLQIFPQEIGITHLLHLYTLDASDNITGDFNIYGTHNITVSTNPPGQLVEGQQYQVY